MQFHLKKRDFTLPHDAVYVVCPRKMYGTPWYDAMRRAARAICVRAHSVISPPDVYTTSQTYHDLFPTFFAYCQVMLLFPGPGDLIGDGSYNEANAFDVPEKGLYVVCLFDDYTKGIRCVHGSESVACEETGRRYTDSYTVLHDDSRALWLAPEIEKDIPAPWLVRIV